MRKKAIFLVFCLVLAIESQVLAMELKSPEFKNNEFIPKKFTYRGENINPELIIGDIPAGTQSIALIFNDPDAPGGDWVHWLVFDMPPVSKIEENSIPGKQGINDFGRIGYDGPFPPSGVHRYIFKVYALDIELNLKEGGRKVDLERAINGHVLAQAELIGLYKK
ncbi:MAG: YbhB/YbcL family Raf kinase inhibitor-like protein [Candidatus Omnitrophica bacterium]|nr:YbhB/YbcL family Raf kinase inhibitor-like protein [Candidatus Omnitrophota bacterium]